MTEASKESLTRAILGMTSPESEVRMVSATEIHRQGRAFADHAVFPWWVDQELCELLDSTNPHVTVGLAVTPQRFAEIRDLLPGVSEKVLTGQLRRLEQDGVLRRRVTPSVPPRVDYELTAAGWELIPIMQSMCDWGSKHLGIVPTLPRAVPLSA